MSSRDTAQSGENSKKKLVNERVSQRLRLIRDAFIYLIIFSLILTIVITQTRNSLSADRSSEDTVLFTTRSSLSLRGVIVRDESLVHSSYTGDGVLSYCVPDGGRISNHSQIARIYSSYDQVYYRYRLEKLNEEIDALEKAQARGTTDYVQPDFILNQIKESYNSILSATVSQSLDGIAEDKLGMLKLMCIYNVASNAESGYDSRLEALKSQQSVYNAVLTNPVSVVNAVESGYFTSVTDGYETEISTDSIDELTVERINEIIATPQKNGVVGSNVIGKVFSTYSWKLVCVINTPDRYFVNGSFDLELSSTNKSYRVLVESITPTGRGDEAIMVLSCDEMDADIAASRVVDAELLFGEYTGIKVLRSAIRFSDGVKGVYVLEGESIEFKPLDVIYEGDDYVLSSHHPDSKSYLGLYDRVLLDPISSLGGSREADGDEAPEDGSGEDSAD